MADKDRYTRNKLENETTSLRDSSSIRFDEIVEPKETTTLVAAQATNTRNIVTIANLSGILACSIACDSPSASRPAKGGIRPDCNL